MSEEILGRFGDRRLEKGGLFCLAAWSRAAGAACVCAVSAAIARGR